MRLTTWVQIIAVATLATTVLAGCAAKADSKKHPSANASASAQEDTWENQAGPEWSAFAAAYETGWSEGCDVTSTLGGGTELSYRGIQVSATSCQDDFSDNSDLTASAPKGAPSRPAPAGHAAGMRDACLYIFDALAPGNANAKLASNKMTFTRSVCKNVAGEQKKSALAAKKAQLPTLPCHTMDSNGQEHVSGLGYHHILATGMSCATAKKYMMSMTTNPNGGAYEFPAAAKAGFDCVTTDNEALEVYFSCEKGEVKLVFVWGARHTTPPELDNLPTASPGHPQKQCASMKESTDELEGMFNHINVIDVSCSQAATFIRSMVFDDKGYVVFPAGRRLGYICDVIDKVDYSMTFHLACVKGQRVVRFNFDQSISPRVL